MAWNPARMPELISQISFYFWSAALHNENFSAMPTKLWWATNRKTTCTAAEPWELGTVRNLGKLVKSNPGVWKMMEYCSKELTERTSTITTPLCSNRSHQTAPGLVLCDCWEGDGGSLTSRNQCTNLQLLSKRAFFHNIFKELYQTSCYATWNGFHPCIKHNSNDPIITFVFKDGLFSCRFVSLCKEDILNCAETTANLIKVCQSKHKID